MRTTDDGADAVAELRAGRWVRAAELFTALTAETDDPHAHEGLAQAAWWLDDAATALGAREAAYRGFRAAGDDRGAARAAAALGYDSMLFGAGVAVGRGWLARSSDLLGERVDVPEVGWLSVRRAEVALNVDHDAAVALGHATNAREVGRATADADLVVVAAALAGFAHVRLGDVDAGMALLDSAAAAATAGDVDDLMWMGKICCWLISACQETHDLGRASDWCARVEEICLRRDLAPLFAVCRTQYASVLHASGDSRGAESTLVEVLAGLERSRRLSRLDAVSQLGEVRRRQGRLVEAEQLLGQAGYLPSALTSLAQLRLDEGDPSRAWSTVAELLRRIPTTQLLDRVDALAVAVPAALASGHELEARGAADELRRIADRVATSAITAHADAAEARMSGPGDDVPLWQDAVRRFHVAGLVFDEADARLELAEALHHGGDDAGAREEKARALAVLAPLRARADRSDAGPLTGRQVEVIRLIARGLNNSEIAAELQVSEHTVHRHVANIYTALDLGSRAAAAAYAVGHGLGRGAP
ncbi:helix-turn-helix domain-containing protein [Nocardioides alpinus]|uniref:helix-turn-helix domain-containing protein n=1 Tax=Nocardioides alpinus TaxID=748909 RepID=UPI00111348E1|nr:helix-turn-helix transcriptional regulator [Nocardioides alpinus]